MKKANIREKKGEKGENQKKEGEEERRAIPLKKEGNIAIHV